MRSIKSIYLLIFIVSLSINNSYCQNKQDTLSWGIGLDNYHPLYTFHVYGANLSATSVDVSDMLGRYARKKDSTNLDMLSDLFSAEPSELNYHNFYELATAFWRVGKDKEAKEMFIKILNSDKDFYKKVYLYETESDSIKSTSADTIVLIYNDAEGYFTGRYKHNVAIFLSEIYIRQRNFDKALFYIDESQNKYKVEYHAPNYIYNYEEMYEILYSTCYKGLNQPKKIIELLLPSSLQRSSDFLIDAIKEVYSSKEIEEALNEAILSINVKLYDEPTTTTVYSTLVEDGKITKSEKTITYHSGTVAMTIFGVPLDFSTTWSRIDLRDGQVLTKELAVRTFKTYYIYKALIKRE